MSFTLYPDSLRRLHFTLSSTVNTVLLRSEAIIYPYTNLVTFVTSTTEATCEQFSDVDLDIINVILIHNFVSRICRMRSLGTRKRLKIAEMSAYRARFPFILH